MGQLLKSFCFVIGNGKPVRTPGNCDIGNGKPVRTPGNCPNRSTRLFLLKIV